MTAAVGKAAAGKVVDVAIQNRSLKQEAGRQVKKSAVKSGRRAVGGQKLLIMEFVVCMVIVSMHPLVEPEEGAGPFMKRGTAISLLFFILGLIGAVGPKASKVSGGIGALVTVGLLIDQRSVFGVMVDKFKPEKPLAPGKIEDAAPDTGNILRLSD